MAEETLTEPAKPAAKAPPPKAGGLSSGKRVVIGLNVILQILAVVVIIGLINWISIRRFVRWDISRDKKFALSSQTKNLVGNLPKQVTAIVYFSGGGTSGQIAPDVMALLKEYEYASKGKLSVETVDPYRNLTRAKELAEKYKFAGEENIVVLDYDGKSKFVNAQDMAEMDMGGNPFMQQPPQVKSFKGEAALTTALLELVEGKAQKLYVTTGHGEAELKTGQPQNPDEAVIIAQYFTRANIKYDPLRLLDVERIPEDAAALLIFGPKQDLSDREIELLDGYWNNKGRVFVLLNGPTKTPRLNAWLAKSGVTPLGGRLVRTVQMLNLRSGQRETRVAASAEGKFTEAGQSIVKDLAGNDAFFFGAGTSLELDKTKATTEQLKFTELAEVGKDYWSEMDPMGGPAVPTRDPAREKEGPFNIAVAVEKGALEGVKVDTARMIVVGNSGFLTDGGVSQYEAGLDFGLGCANWLLNRESGAGVGIPPKQKNLTPLTLDENQQRQLALAVVLGLPAVVFIFGTISWLQRRN